MFESSAPSRPEGAVSPERRAGHSRLHGRPLDDNGAIEFTVERSVPTLQALVEQWRERAIREHERGNVLDASAGESRAYAYGREHALDFCANELEAYLTAGAQGGKD